MPWREAAPSLHRKDNLISLEGSVTAGTAFLWHRTEGNLPSACSDRRAFLTAHFHPYISERAKKFGKIQATLLRQLRIDEMTPILTTYSW